jgi:FkbH-like protein
MRRLELLPDVALKSLASLIAAVDAAENIGIPWQKQVRIHFLRNFAIEPLEPYLKYYLMREEAKPLITFGGYDSMEQEILDPDSTLNRNSPDIIVLSLLIECFDRNSTVSDWTADRALVRLDDLINSVIANTNAIILANIMPPPVDIMLSGKLKEHKNSELERINDRLIQIAKEKPDRVVLSDWNHYLSTLPTADAVDSRFWRLSQAPFKRGFLNQYANDIAKLARGIRAPAKKCLVLDCDNTLWGGVVGEDGQDGILLHSTESPGRYFHLFQQSVLSLHERGVMIALCSKNNEQDVWDVIESHPNCLLKKDHLVAWRINWENKATNIVSIAEELNIGLDSMVFIDDSPQECALVQEILPEVMTIQRPDDLARMADVLTTGGLFDSPTSSNEDRFRTQMYQQEAKRKDERNKFDDLTAYLNSLSTETTIERVRDEGLARIAQLTQKTNQFNVTTRRYSETEIREFVDSPDTAVFSMSVADRYGDMGVTGVMIARRNGLKVVIDTFLLSCRVLGRQLEFAFIDQCMRQIEKMWRVESWEAEYSPTRKNSQVSDFWDRVGFERKKGVSETQYYSAEIFSRPAEYLNIMNVHVE